MILQLALTALLVAANGFFVATEFALARLRPTQIADFEAQRLPGAKSVRHAVEHIDAYLAACQLGITIASLGLGVLGERAFNDLFENLLGEGAAVAGVAVAGALAFAIITLLHIVFGELSPKSLAIARTNRVVLLVAPPMRVYYLVARPLVDLFNGLGNLVLKPFGIPPAREVGSEPHSEDELRLLLRESSREGLIDPEEQRFSENVLTFGDRRAREVMRPRPEVVWVADDATVREAAQVAIEAGLTRLPVCERDRGLDAPVGLVHAKDMLAAALANADAKVSALARQLHVVADGTLIDELLATLRRQREHMALVVDEHGTAVGLVTLEDVLEEIVGEIEDEFDRPPDAEVVRENGGWRISGGASLHDVETALGVDLPDSHEATIGGYLLERLGRLPDEGEEVDLLGMRAKVLSVKDARIGTLRISR
jgi:CBS domain containing-hemolysin-like protein